MLRSFTIQGILVPKQTLGPFLTLLTLSVRNGPNRQSYLFQENISLNPRRVEQNYTIVLLKKWLKIYVETINVNFKQIIRCENCYLMILHFIFGTYPYFETINGFQVQLMSRFQNISWF